LPRINTGKLAVFLSRRKKAVFAQLRAYSVHLGYRSKPAFLIIGAQKAGTTALYYYLAEHPNIVPSTEKEVGFFAPEIFADWPEHPNHWILCTREGAPHFTDARAHRRALAWYHRHFPAPHELGRHRVTFEATPEYLYYPEAAARIFQYEPKMRLIVLLRDPVERAFAAWNMYSRFGDYRPRVYAPRKEAREFAKAVEDEINDIQSGKAIADPGYVRRGIYYEQLERYFAYFQRGQLLILDSRTLRSNTPILVNEAIRFLELPEYQHGVEWKPIHVGQYETAIPITTRRLLQDFYKPHNERLYGLLDHDFEWS
jgi:hypothetical protein